MKKLLGRIIIVSAAFTLLLTSCNKNKAGVWDDSKSATGFNTKEGRNLWGNDGGLADEFSGPAETDFVPLQDEDLKAQFADGSIPQPKATPGEDGSGIPGIEHFSSATGALASVFRNVYFNTDDHILRGKDHLATLDKISSYLKEHPHTYIFVTGHCDERGPEAYNLSLGARRANYVRTMLVQRGVDLNQIHTISYGKEKPAIQGHTPEAWAKNRRAEFKIYSKS